jgi:cytochrome P450
MLDSCEMALRRYAQFDSDLLANPYLLFDELRTADPVHRSSFLDGWVLTRYRDISAILRDARVSSNRQPAFMRQLPQDVFEEMRPLARIFSAMVGLSDPPAHTRLRGLVNKAFTPRMVEALRPRIREIVNELLDQVFSSGRMDVIADFAYPLPAIVIAEMLGVPTQDRDQFKRWSDDFIAYIGTLRAIPDRARQAQKSLLEMKHYLQEIVIELRRRPQNNLISALVAAEEHGDKLSEEELLAMCISLLAGGHETTTNLIGNGLLALLKHPLQLQRLRDDPELAPTAVEELLRYDGSVQRLERIALKELEIDGRRISPGDRLLLMIGAANRDPAQFSDPHQLELGRQPNPHLAFAAGPHFCVGAPLARVEIQVAMNSLLCRLPNLKLTDQAPIWQQNVAHRGLKSLNVEFDT